MPDKASGGVTIDLDGTHLRVDARPARLVSMLRAGSGGAVVTAQPSTGSVFSQAVPAPARQATFRIRDGITVEATSAADFVAVSEESGRCLVVSYAGEVTVIPNGDDRFALAAHEAIVLPGGTGRPEVVPAGELGSHAGLASLLDDVADAVLAAKTPDTPEPAAEPATEEQTTPAPTPATPAKAGATPAKAASKSTSQRRKKGKKGRPQPAKTAAKKAAVATPATKTAKPAPGAGGPKPPANQPPRGGGGGGGGGGDRRREPEPEPAGESSRDNRFLIGAVLAAVVVAVLLVFLLTSEDDPDDGLATGTTTTVEEEATTAAPSTTNETVATTTSAPAATTTTARASTTTAARPAPNYAIEPKSCVQNGNSVTYTASVKNSASAAFDFTVDVSFKAADGGEVARATATLTDVAPGATKEFSATGTSSRNLAGTGASCDVTRVDAQPSG